MLGSDILVVWSPEQVASRVEFGDHLISNIALTCGRYMVLGGSENLLVSKSSRASPYFHLPVSQSRFFVVLMSCTVPCSVPTANNGVPPVLAARDCEAKEDAR